MHPIHLFYNPAVDACMHIGHLIYVLAPNASIHPNSYMFQHSLYSSISSYSYSSSLSLSIHFILLAGISSFFSYHMHLPGVYACMHTIHLSYVPAADACMHIANLIDFPADFLSVHPCNLIYVQLVSLSIHPSSSSFISSCILQPYYATSRSLYRHASHSSLLCSSCRCMHP